jgi:hypothetical protein
MERELAPLLRPHFEQGPRALEQVLLVAPALEHWLAEHELARQPRHCLPCRLHLDYCREQCCWMMKMTMTWGLGRTDLNSLRVWAGIRVTKVMLELRGFFRP